MCVQLIEGLGTVLHVLTDVADPYGHTWFSLPFTAFNVVFKGFAHVITKIMCLLLNITHATFFSAPSIEDRSVETLNAVYATSFSFVTRTS